MTKLVLMNSILATLLSLLTSGSALRDFTVFKAEHSETVLVTFRVKPGKESEFLNTYARAWKAYKNAGLVFDSPHLLLKSAEAGGKTHCIEILTWKRGGPDNAPAEIKAIWNEMQLECEQRDGHPGIDGLEVKPVGSAIQTGFAKPGNNTETVISAFRVTSGKESDFLKTEAEAWSIYNRLNMVLPQVHLVFQGTEPGTQNPIFFSVQTWKDHDAPDHAPHEVREVWNKLEALAEKRNGHRGIEFEEVAFVE